MLRQRRFIIILVMLLLGISLFLLARHKIYSPVPAPLRISPPASLSASVDPPVIIPSASVVIEPNKSAYELWQEIESITVPPKQRFYKVAMNGELLSQDALNWDCVYDQSTSLLWEVKQSDGGWQDNQHTYSWYEPPKNQTIEPENNELPITVLNKPEYGVANKGSCYDIACDTHSYKQAVNEQRLCSSVDWRLPESHELGMLDHPTDYNPDIDIAYFPNTQGNYWTRTVVPSMKTLAWSVDFSNGIPYIVEKRVANRVRLVTVSARLADELKKTSNKLQ